MQMITVYEYHHHHYPPKKEKDVKYVVNTFEILKRKINGIQLQVWKTKFVSQLL